MARIPLFSCQLAWRGFLFRFFFLFGDAPKHQTRKMLFIVEKSVAFFVKKEFNEVYFWLLCEAKQYRRTRPVHFAKKDSEARQAKPPSGRKKTANPGKTTPSFLQPQPRRREEAYNTHAERSFIPQGGTISLD